MLRVSKISFLLVIISFFPLVTTHTCYSEDSAVAAAHENVASAIGEKDYAKAALKCKELVVAAGISEELEEYAESAFLSINSGNDSEYLAAIQKIINNQNAEAKHKAMLLDLVINAPLGAEKYTLVKQATQLVYAAPSLLGTDSAAMIFLADHTACQNLNDAEGAINAARKLLQTPESDLRVLAANNIAYGAVHFSARRVGSSDRTLKEIVGIFKSDKQIMDSEAASVVLYAGIMDKLFSRTIEGVKGEMDEIFAIHKARNKEVEKDVLYYVGHYVEQLMQCNLIAPEGKQIVFPCYQKLLEVYPDCNEAKYAAWRLFEQAVEGNDVGNTIVYGEFLLSRFSVDDQPVFILFPVAEAYLDVGLYKNAAENYQKFLLKSLSTDYRRKIAIQRLQTIEGMAPGATIISDEILRTVIGGNPKGPRSSGNAHCGASGDSGACNPECTNPPSPSGTCSHYAGCECIETNYGCMSGGLSRFCTSLQSRFYGVRWELQCHRFMLLRRNNLYFVCADETLRRN